MWFCGGFNFYGDVLGVGCEMDQQQMYDYVVSGDWVYMS